MSVVYYYSGFFRGLPHGLSLSHCMLDLQAAALLPSGVDDDSPHLILPADYPDSSPGY